MGQRDRRVRERHPIKCRDCGAEVIAFRSDARCPTCKAEAVIRKWQEHERRFRHPCPGCGSEIARTSKQCRRCGQKARVQKLSGENSTNWKGGRSVSKGYVYLLASPEARKGHRYRAEHILVWEAANGPLPDGYVVHHLNGIKDDNRLSNLEAMPRKKHNHRHDEHDRRIVELEAEVARLRSQLNGLPDTEVPS